MLIYGRRYIFYFCKGDIYPLHPITYIPLSPSSSYEGAVIFEKIVDFSTAAGVNLRKSMGLTFFPMPMKIESSPSSADEERKRIKGT